jgi:ketosteroid isomerase-like protein
VSGKNAELVRGSLEAYADWFNSTQRDIDDLAPILKSFAAPDIVYAEDPVWPDAGTYRGRDAFLKRFLEYAEILQIGRVEIEEVLDAGDSVLAEVRMTFLSGGAGSDLDHLWAYTARLDEQGRVTHWRAWFDPKEARKATGLSE